MLINRCQFREGSFPALLLSTDRNPDHAGCAVPHAVPEHHGGGGEGGGERGGQQEAEVGGHGEVRADWGLETLERGDTDTVQTQGDNTLSSS